MNEVFRKFLGEGRQLGLALGVCTGDDESCLLMKETQVPLAGEVETTVDGLGIDQAR